MSTEKQAILQQSIARESKGTDFIQVDRRTLDEAFPHPERLSLQEMDDMITLAIVGNIPPPPEQPMQEEQITKFCRKHDLILKDNGWENFVTFVAKGTPAVLRDRTKSKMEDCDVGEFVHESNIPLHVRGGCYAQCIPRGALNPFGNALPRLQRFPRLFR